MVTSTQVHETPEKVGPTPKKVRKSRKVSRGRKASKSRWKSFCCNRRAYWALWIFLLLFVVSLFAECIANERPLFIWYKGDAYFPAFMSYPETDFGGIFESEADYTDPYTLGEIKKGGWVLYPPVRYSYNTQTRDEPTSLMPPSETHWLGTDDANRDVFSRLIYGYRISIIFALSLMAISSVVGVLMALVQGYIGGWVDLLGQRFVEIWSNLPSLFILLILTSFIKPSFGWLLGILTLFSWPMLVSVVRAEVLRTRKLDYVRAAKALGMPGWRVALKHVLPNALVSTLTYLPFIASGAILSLTALDFLGFGLPPGSPSLGELLRQGKENLSAPWLGITAFFAIFVPLVLLVFIGEGARDAFDPRKSLTSSTKGKS